jgi:hypothetical protein
MIGTFLEQGLPCSKMNLMGGARTYYFRKIMLFLLSFWLCNANLLAQGCDFMPGDVALVANGDNSNPFYKTDYFIVDSSNDSILQVNTLPHFANLTKGAYKVYAVNYKIRDSILNLEAGKFFSDIKSDCLDFSDPYVFSVCTNPNLSSIETSDLELCADGTKLSISDSIIVMDGDGSKDTFSLNASIVNSPDLFKDSLDVDLSSFIGLQKNYSAPVLMVSGIKSPSQLQAILRAIHFYSNSSVPGVRVIEFEVLDGQNKSNAQSRKIHVFPLPGQPIQIFRKKKN